MNGFHFPSQCTHIRGQLYLPFFMLTHIFLFLNSSNHKTTEVLMIIKTISLLTDERIFKETQTDEGKLNSGQ